MRTTIHLIALAVLIVTPPLVARSRGPVAHAPGLQAPAADAGDVAEGMRLYLQKGDCQSCHGWAADGRKMDSQMPDAPNLRETRLTRERLTQIIKCGRPGT